MAELGGKASHGESRCLPITLRYLLGMERSQGGLLAIVTAPPSPVGVCNCHQEAWYCKCSPPVRYPIEVIPWKGARSSLRSLWLALSLADVCMLVLSLLGLENPSLFVFPDENRKVLIKHFSSIFTNDFP